jgi:hypothetical protein
MKTEKIRTAFQTITGPKIRSSLIVFGILAIGLASHSWARVDENGGNRNLGDRNGEVENKETDLTQLSKTDAQALSLFVTQIARQHLPHAYEDDRHWGMTRQRWDGIHFEVDRFQLKTRQRRKEVNHGFWRRFDVELIHPKRDFEVRLSKIRQRPSGELAFDLQVISPLRVTGRIAQWNHGVQVLSLSAEANAKVRLSVSARLGLNLDFTHTPPDVVLKPIVDRAEITLLEFEVERVSKIGGEVAEQLGRASRQFLESRIEKEEDRLVEKLNRSIEKHEDDLTISMHDFLASQWGRIAAKGFSKRADDEPAPNELNSGVSPEDTAARPEEASSS